MESLGLDLRNQMISNAIAYNNALTKEYLTQKSTSEIMAFTNPTDRSEFYTTHFKLYGFKISTTIYEN